MAQKADPKVSEWLSYSNSRKVTQKPAFSEKVQRGDQGKFFKNHPKSGPPFKNPTALWRKWHYPLIRCTYSAKDGKDFGAKSGSKRARMAKLWQFRQGHPKPAFS